MEKSAQEEKYGEESPGISISPNVEYPIVSKGLAIFNSNEVDNLSEQTLDSETITWDYASLSFLFEFSVVWYATSQHFENWMLIKIIISSVLLFLFYKNEIINTQGLL